jgi:hypothetical protein
MKKKRIRQVLSVRQDKMKSDLKHPLCMGLTKISFSQCVERATVPMLNGELLVK